MAALLMPYSPKLVRGSSSVTGTRAVRPCTQMVPQCRMQRPRRPERVDEVLGGCGGEADQVDDCVRLKAGDPPTEDAGDFLGDAVSVNTLYRPPLHSLVVRLPFAATHRHDLMPGADQAGHEVTADVPRRPNHHHAPHTGRLQRWPFRARAPFPGRHGRPPERLCRIDDDDCGDRDARATKLNPVAAQMNELRATRPHRKGPFSRAFWDDVDLPGGCSGSGGLIPITPRELTTTRRRARTLLDFAAGVLRK